ncbi:MAG: hypothetical protein KAR06_04470 [Deltaproteobacteria bacterium]|nr:hypothetical protein [Deltaproteobacteria bacterium]
MYNCSRYRIKWVADVIVTKVIFRKYPEGDVIALFPDNSYRRNYMTECYQHIGQHGEGDYRGVVASTKPATPEEYADLKAELESIGYDLDVRKRAKITYRSLQC